MSSPGPFLQASPCGIIFARARSACHNCLEANMSCDRHRPKCLVCVKNNRLCQGYNLELSWQSGIASAGHLKGFNYPATPVNFEGSFLTATGLSLGGRAPKKKQASMQKFKFVPGRIVKRRIPRKQAGENCFNSRPKSGPTPGKTTFRSSNGIAKGLPKSGQQNSNQIDHSSQPSPKSDSISLSPSRISPLLCYSRKLIKRQLPASNSVLSATHFDKNDTTADIICREPLL
jgi:hypothetical protein